MALVKCTQIVHDHVIKKINEMFEERIKEAYKMRSPSVTETAKIAYNLVHTPERIAAMRLVEATHRGNSLYSPSDQFKFKVVIGDYGREINIKWSSPRDTYHPFVSQYGAAAEIDYLPDEVKKEVLAANDRRRAVEKERSAFTELFKDAWKKVRSVNELIKLWPAVVELLPADVMPRIERKSGPRHKEEPAFDAAQLNVSLLKAKVAK